MKSDSVVTHTHTNTHHLCRYTKLWTSDTWILRLKPTGILLLNRPTPKTLSRPQKRWVDSLLNRLKRAKREFKGWTTLAIDRLWAYRHSTSGCLVGNAICHSWPSIPSLMQFLCSAGGPTRQENTSVGAESVGPSRVGGNGSFPPPALAPGGGNAPLLPPPITTFPSSFKTHFGVETKLESIERVCYE